MVPPSSFISLVHEELHTLLSDNPAATQSESYLQNCVEFEILKANVSPRYYVRTGINYHGQTVQQLKLDDNGVLVGWNPTGDALGIGSQAKMLLAGYTIVHRDADEPMMNDTKIGGGSIPTDTYLRIEFKARGWLGKTKNLAGKQLEKDLDLLKDDNADLLIIALSETAHRKWRGEGPAHHVRRRSGIERFKQILVPLNELQGEGISERKINFEEQNWTISSQCVIGKQTSFMPSAEHIVTLCWRRN